MKKTSKKNVAALEDVAFLETNDPAVCAVELIDADKRTFAVAVDASGIAAVIGRLFDQAVHPQFAEASLRTAKIRRCHIDGSRLELRSGRSPTEIAATVTIGCVELVVFLPLEEVLRSFGELAPRLEQYPGAH